MKKRIRKVRRIARRTKRRLIESNDLIEAMRVHIGEMNEKNARLEPLRPLLSLHPEALQALLGLVPYLRHRPGRPAE